MKSDGGEAYPNDSASTGPQVLIMNVVSSPIIVPRECSYTYYFVPGRRSQMLDTNQQLLIVHKFETIEKPSNEL